MDCLISITETAEAEAQTVIDGMFSFGYFYLFLFLFAFLWVVWRGRVVLRVPLIVIVIIILRDFMPSGPIVRAGRCSVVIIIFHFLFLQQRGP
jgi:hypothetical protein